jgi:hypothetical protein
MTPTTARMAPIVQRMEIPSAQPKTSRITPRIITLNYLFRPRMSGFQTPVSPAGPWFPVPAVTNNHQSRSEANRAPSNKAASFCQATSGRTVGVVANVAYPQCGPVAEAVQAAGMGGQNAFGGPLHDRRFPCVRDPFARVSDSLTRVVLSE